MRHPIAVLRRAVARWQLGRTQPGEQQFSEDGDTLVEVLLAIVVLGITAMALLLGFGTAITSSVEHRNLASLDSSTRLAANEAIADVQQQAGNANNNPFLCPTSFVPNFNNLPASFAVSYTMQYWSTTNSNFNAANPCAQYAPQQYTLTVSSTSSSNYSAVVSTVVYDPAAPPSPNGVGAPSQLVWIPPEPSGGTVGTPITPQPEVAVEGTSGNIVTSDLSSVTLNVLSGPGTFTSTCSAVESYGIVQFSGCSVTKAGTYSIEAVDSNTGVTVTPPDSFTVGAAPPAKIVFTSTPVSGTASNSATLGGGSGCPGGLSCQITVQEQDAFNNPTTAAETVSLSSTSPGGVFSLSSGGAPVTSVTIPSGQSTASFYYGDTVAGSPTITAAVSGLASGTQSETIKAGPASKLGFTTSPFTAPASSTATTSFTVALEDAFGNVTTKTTSTTVTLASSSGTGIFATTKGGTATTTVTIGANQTSVSPFYGDITVGTPTLTASATGLSPSATQTETITIAPAKLVFTTTPMSGTDSTNASIGQITVQEQASNGTPTTVGETVTLSSSSAGPYIFNTSQYATTPTGTTTVNIPSGQSSVSFYYGDTKTGTPTITAAASGLTSATQTETITVGPVAQFGLSNPGTLTAGTGFTETVTAEDAGGNIVTSFNGTNCVVFSGPGTSPAPSSTAPSYPAAVGCASGSSLTFTNGAAPAPITLFDAQSTSLHAVDGAFTGTSATFTVNAAPTTKFALSTPSPTAGTQFNETITATDNYSNTTTGYRNAQCLTFSGPHNSPAPSNRAPTYPGRGVTCGAGTSSVTFTNGVGTAAITLFDAETVTLTASQGTITGTSASFTVATGPLGSLSVANPGTQKAGVGFTDTITALDAYSNSYSGVLNPTFSGPSNSPNGTHPLYPGSLTFTNGTATAAITLYDAQTTTLKVTSGAVSGTSTSFTVTGGTATGFLLTNPGTQTAGTAFNLTITAGDAYGNGSGSLTGTQCITFSGPLNSPAPSSTPPAYPAAGGCGSGSSVTFNGSGVGTASITLYDAAASTTLTATQGTFTGSTTFAVNSGPVLSFTFPTSPGSPQTAGTPFNVTLDATDAYSNPFAGTECVTFSGPSNSPAPSNTAPTYPAKGACATGSSSLTFAAGAVTASVTLFDAQTTSLTASATGVSGATTGTFTVNPGTAHSFSLANPGTQTAGTAFTENLTALDTWSNTATGFTGTECVTFSGPSNSPAPSSTPPAYPARAGCGAGASSLTFAAGLGSASITLFDAQTPTLTATQGTITGSTSFTVTAAGAHSFSLANPGTQAAGTAFTENVTALDTWDNTATGFTGTQCITFSGPLNSPAPSSTPPAYPAAGGCGSGSSVTFNGSGVGTASITLYDAAASTTLTATQGTFTGSTTFAVNSGPVLSFTFPTSPGSPQTAGTPFNVTLDATDAYSNPFAGTECVTFSGPSNSPAPSNTAPTYPAKGACATGSSSLTFAAGAVTASVTLFDAQTTSLTASATGVSGATTGTFTVNPGTAHSFSLANPGTQTAGTAFTENLTALDTWSNTATGFTGTECVTFSGPSNSPAPSSTPPAYPARAGCGAGASSLTFAAGLGSASITLFDAQTPTLTATQGTITGSTSFTVTAAGAHTLTATSGAGQTAGLNKAFTNPMVATVTDLYSNPVSGVNVTFTAPANGASATFAACASNPANACVQATGANGQATSSTFTANGTAGTYNIAASATGVTSVNFSETNKAIVTIFSSATGQDAGSTTESVTLGTTPISGSTVVALVYAEGNGAVPTTPTISGNGVTGTVTTITHVSPTAGNYEEWAFWANASGTGGTVTATFGGTTPLFIEVDAIALAGNNTTTPIAQNRTDTGTGNFGGTNPVALLTTTPASGDMELALLGADGNSGGVGTAPTGWTNIENNNSGGAPTYGVASYDTNTNGATSTTFAFTTTRLRWATIALDINHA